MRYAMFVWVSRETTDLDAKGRPIFVGAYERENDRNFPIYGQCATARKLQCRDWAAAGVQFKIRRVTY